MVNLLLEEVLYVPAAGCNPFSPGLALDLGYQLTWDKNARLFGLIKDEVDVIRTHSESHLWMFTAQNIVHPVLKPIKVTGEKNVFTAFAVTDGVDQK